MGQTIKGLVTDSLGNPLSFVNVFVKNSQTGTTTNEFGRFTLSVSEESEIILVFQYVGFKQIEKKVNTSDKNELQVVLYPMIFELKEASVSATAEDPAYPIMRQVIARSKLYANEIKESDCRVYVKILQRITSYPERIFLLKIPSDIKPGIIYLSESISELKFKSPNTVNEKLISSKVSGNSKGFSFNRAGALKFNFYEPVLSGFGLNQRGFISPLSPNAFSFYHYKLEGFEIENDLKIYKIKVIPKKENQPLFKGYIYIVKDLWRLYGTDLILDKNANIEFVDNLNIKQNFMPLPNGIWVPKSNRFILSFEILGIKGNGYIIAFYSNYKAVSNYNDEFYKNAIQSLKENNPVPEVRKVNKIKAEKIKNFIKEKSTQKNKNELLCIADDANKTSNEVWDSIRPIELTDEEIMEYKKGDSIEMISESKVYKDSIDKLNNKPGFLSVVINGFTLNNTIKKSSVSFKPVIQMLQFNSVEGMVLNQQIKYTKKIDNEEKKFSIYPTLRYGFSSKKFFYALGTGYTYNTIKLGSIKAEAGKLPLQINNSNPISPWVNSIYTLMGLGNYMKLYESSFLFITHETELTNGFFNKFSLKYESRNPLLNTTNYNFNNNTSENFTSNLPFNIINENKPLQSHNAFIFETDINIRFNQKYISRAKYRYRFSSNYPDININYKKAIPIGNTSINFDKIIISAKHNTKINIYGTLNWYTLAGKFINNTSLSFIDFHHFNGNQTIFANRGFGGFQLLNYYLYSTNSRFIELSAIHHFNGYLFSKIGLNQKTKLEEIAGIRYLKTPESPHITELVLGLEHIFKVFRADINFQYTNNKHTTTGIRLGYGF